MPVPILDEQFKLPIDDFQYETSTTIFSTYSKLMGNKWMEKWNKQELCK